MCGALDVKNKAIVNIKHSSSYYLRIIAQLKKELKILNDQLQKCDIAQVKSLETFVTLKSEVHD